MLRKHKLLEMFFIFIFIYPFTTNSWGKKIIWDKTSIIKIDSNIDYCRVRRLSNGNIAVVYRHILGCKLKVYNAEGKCIIENLVFKNQFLYNKQKSRKSYVLMANPELLELNSGRLLYVCNYRPLKEHSYPFSIASSYSDDGGYNWSKAKIIYKADTLYSNGCWEPSLIQLPNGIVQVYFANENNFKKSNEQEIDMMESNDNGSSWKKKLKRISFSEGKRDGMPVAKVYNDSIYVIIEDNTYGDHRPSIVKSSISDNWKKYVKAFSPYRQDVFGNSYTFYGGAPYLSIDSKGTQYISCQSNYKRADKEHTNLLVVIREKGKITDSSYPFDIPQNKYGRWGAIELINDSTIFATISSNINGECAPYIIKGKIVNDGE